MKSPKVKLLVLDVDGTMTDGGIYISTSGEEMKRFDAKDGRGILLAKEAGIEVGIISHSYDSRIVKQRAKMLSLSHCYVGKEDKVVVLQQWATALNILWEEIAFIGDDVNDLSVMQKVGWPVCPNDAVPKIKEISRIILSKKGGQGCIREFVDLYLL